MVKRCMEMRSRLLKVLKETLYRIVIYRPFLVNKTFIVFFDLKSLFEIIRGYDKMIMLVLLSKSLKYINILK
jgi:hypothetical protein